MSKSIECPTPRVNPNVDCGLGVIMACQCGFISYNTCAMWYRMLIAGEAVGGGRHYMRTLCFLPSFSVNVKLSKK